MSALFFLIACSLAAAIGFLFMFIWAVRHGQYEDTYTPSIRMLHDDPQPKSNAKKIVSDNSLGEPTDANANGVV